MKSYRVFLGAPPASEIKIRRDEYHWQTVSEPAATPISQHHVDITLPVTIVEAASKRISALYENIIFREDDDESHYLSVLGLVPSVRPGLDPLGTSVLYTIRSFSDIAVEYADDATAITWLPTVQDVTDTHEASRLAFTFLRPSASVANIHPAEETQGTGSYDHSDASSVGIFPDFHFSIHDLTSLSHLAAQAQSDAHKPGAEGSKTSQKVTLLAAVLEVDGPDTIHIKQGAEAGKEVSLLKLILGDEEGAVSKLTAWREVAESWGGSDPAETETTRVKRGDIVLLESASYLIHTVLAF